MSRTVLLLALMMAGAVRAANDEPPPADWFDFGGTFKSFANASRTPVTDDRFWSSLNRLKLNFDFTWGRTEVRASIDNEWVIGSLLDTDEFQFIKDFEPNNRIDWSAEIADTDNLYWRTNVYRLYARYTTDNTATTIGHQRIAWGTARLWNPTDLFNPISPLQIERDQRPAVDAASFEYFMGELSKIDVVYAWGKDSELDSAAARLSTNVLNYDWSVLAGEFRGDNVVGMDFAGNIGKSGLRGEATFTNPEEGDTFWRGVLSWDYSFQSSLYLLAEYFYNGGNVGDPNNPGSGVPDGTDRLFNGDIITRNRNFMSGAVGYDLTPLLRFDMISVYDIDGNSMFVAPVITYNWFTNLDVLLGVQVFGGPEESEYGDQADVYYGWLKGYF